MLGAIRGNRLDAGERRRIDHFDGSRKRGDRNVDLLAILGHGDVVRASTQRNALDDGKRLCIDHGQRVVPFNADVETGPIGRANSPMIRRQAFDLTHNLIGCRIDQVNVISTGIGLKNSNLAESGGYRKSGNQSCPEYSRTHGVSLLIRQ